MFDGTIILARSPNYASSVIISNCEGDPPGELIILINHSLNIQREGKPCSLHGCSLSKHVGDGILVLGDRHPAQAQAGVVG